MELSLQQKLSKEANRRAIQSCDDLAELKKLTLLLLDGYYGQRAAAIWAMGQQFNRPGHLPLPVRDGSQSESGAEE